jgi:hypothetical protein
MSPLKTLCRVASALLLALSGSVFVNCGAYGAPPPPHDKRVTLDDFSYTPAGPIHVGDALTFTATLNKHTDNGGLFVEVGMPVAHSLQLSDDGWDADAVAGDGIYTIRVSWTEEYGTGENLPIKVRLRWWDSYPGQHRTAAGGRAMKCCELRCASA